MFADKTMFIFIIDTNANLFMLSSDSMYLDFPRSYCNPIWIGSLHEPSVKYQYVYIRPEFVMSPQSF